MGSLGVPELLIIFLVILLVFGAKRIPEIARGMGKGIREFKDATSDIKRELTIEDEAPRRNIQAPRQPSVGTPEPRQAAQQPREAETRTVKPDIEEEGSR
jgi:sec-independent protein translocase protein TatA